MKKTNRGTYETLQEILVKALREYLNTVKDTEGKSKVMAELQPDFAALVERRKDALMKLSEILEEAPENTRRTATAALAALVDTTSRIDSAVADAAFVHGFFIGDVEARENESNMDVQPVDSLLYSIFNDGNPDFAVIFNGGSDSSSLEVA